MRTRLFGLAVGVATAFAAGGIMIPWRSHLSIATPGLVLVIPVVVGVIIGGYAGGFLSAASGFVVYDFAFIPPYDTLSVKAGQNWLALGVYVVVMLLVAQVAAHLRTARAQAQRREEEAKRLSTLSELVVEGGSIEELLETLVNAIWTVFSCDGVAVLLPDHDHLKVAASAGTPMTAEELRRLQPAAGLPVQMGATGQGSEGLTAIALTAASGPVGMLALRGLVVSAPDGAVLRAFANHVALALERVQLRTQALRSELLEEIDRIRRDLLGAVSHDLRTPLATMKMASSTLLDPDATLSAEDTRELYTLLDVQTDRLARLVTSLLDLSRYESGVLQLERHPTAVLDLVGNALAGIRPSLGEREVEFDIPSSLPDVDIDPILIGQVLANLLDNAERHSPADEPIRIAAEVRGARVALSVIDHGKGVAVAERDSVFESFVHFDTGGRAGLGLAIAKTFIDAHHEEIWVDDDVGGGARFVFTMLASTGGLEHPS